MPYGQFDTKQRRALKHAIRGKRVHDLGCGDQLISGDLVQWGASEVIAIDCHPYGSPGPKIKTLKMTFEDYATELFKQIGPPDIDVAFLSWPANKIDPSLVLLLKCAKTVCYLGKCTDGISCGFPGLFDHFLHRELVAYVPDEYNTLCIYGPMTPTRRQGKPEECAGLDWVEVRPYYDSRGRHAGA